MIKGSDTTDCEDIAIVYFGNCEKTDSDYVTMNTVVLEHTRKKHSLTHGFFRVTNA